MGILKNITDEYFGDVKREEDFPDITNLDIDIVSFTDNNGKFHKSGYRVMKSKSDNNMSKTLSALIEKTVEKYGIDCDLNFIDVSNIRSMSISVGTRFKSYESIFRNVCDFNGDISGWDVSNVEIMASMFSGMKKFDGDLSRWDVSNVRNMNYMFENSGFTGENGMFKLESGNSLNSMNFMFNNSNFKADISDWDVSGVVEMDYVFNGTLIKLPKWYKEK